MYRPRHPNGTPASDSKVKARESTLTFAAVWDPEKGLETYAGDELQSLSPTLPEKNISVSKGKTLESDQPTLCNEPFAVFSDGQTHFIDIRTSSAYEQYINGPGRYDSSSLASPLGSSSSSSSGSIYSSPSIPNSPKRPNAVESPQAKEVHTLEPVHTPSSKFTFAALWDPETGILAYKNGHPLNPQSSKKHAKWPSITTTATQRSRFCGKFRPNPSQCDMDGLDEFKPGAYLPRSSEPCYRNAVPSSTLEGYRGPWNDSCFDNLNQGLPFESRRAFSEFEGSLGPYPLYMYPGDVKDTSNESYSVEDEGFFETSGHLDIDPHLPSRFSTTTTSTSTYIAIDPNSVQSISQPQFLRSYDIPSSGIASHPEQKNLFKNRMMRSKSFGETPPGQPRRERKASDAPPVPRLSTVFRRPWSKRPQDDRWVLVEVQSVVTDRIIDV